MIGPENYALLRKGKHLGDPQAIFNPGKIVDTPPMDRHLRYAPGQPNPDIPTVFDWSSTRGVLRAAEMCNGSGDCRKTEHTGGTMCPSYMATRREPDTTRARANLLRQVLTTSNRPNPFDSEELKSILDLCISCKGCKKECPSTVDMAKLKAEFQQQYYDVHGSPLRARLVARFAQAQRAASLAPFLWNFAFGTPALRRVLNSLSGFHPDRTIPLLSPVRFSTWFRRHTPAPAAGAKGRVLLFADEFTEFVDAEIGARTVELLERLGYTVEIPELLESGRTWLSKGFLRQARDLLHENLRRLEPVVSSDRPLVGIEPSAILTFRDEAVDLAGPSLRDTARRIGSHCLTLEEFLVREAREERISAGDFNTEPARIHLHGHCFQKALVGTVPAVAALSLPRNYTVTTIPSGCCGMAGSFGYEREHYSISQQIGNLVLFPAVREASENSLIAASGTSCRHQILDGTGRRALHPAEILHQALRSA